MNEVNADMPARALCCFYLPGVGTRLGGVYAGRVVDLSAREPALCASLAALLSAPTGALDDVLRRYAGAAPDFAYAALDRAPAPDVPHLLAPIDSQEVWAAGVLVLAVLMCARARADSVSNNTGSSATERRAWTRRTGWA